MNFGFFDHQQFKSYTVSLMKKKKIENYVMYLEQILGEGSFGKVYKGLNEVDKTPVAIKVLSKKMIDEDEASKEAYITEIKIMKKLHSKNIVEFKDVIQTENNYYVVQEFCEGGDLRTKLNKELHFSEKMATEYLSQLLNGFIQLLTHGIIHRDMKPENILISDVHIKIADFGFAKNVLWRSQLMKTQVGTPLYMSIEMLSEQKYTSKCDIWAIGILYYEMIFGRLPWTAKGEYELVENILKNPLKFPKEPAISQNAKNFLQGCLKIAEQDRFGWNEVFNHPLFEGKFKQFISNHDRLERKAKQVMNQIRLAIHTQDKDLENLFQSMGMTPTSIIKKAQLFQILKELDKALTEGQFQFLWDKLDSGKSGQIEFERFRTYLTENGVRLRSNRNKKDKQSGKNEVQQKINQIIVKIRSKIEVHKLNIETVFSSYTKNKQTDLNSQMFTRLVLKIDPNLTEQQIRFCFDAFDINHDGKITFAQFAKTLKGVKK